MAIAHAKLKSLSIAPRKVRLVADLIRGKKVADARDILNYTLKGSAEPLRKLLDSAAANAELEARNHNTRVDADAMVVEKIIVNEGRTLKRFQNAPRGRATRIRKRSSHVELTIADE